MRTTWDGLRVSPEAYEEKHPQLTPARRIGDPQALRDPRPTDGFSTGSVTALSSLFPSTAGQGSV
tara:strand:- start:1322 stop:1516 length:195 start_codon:yes stop_codon:yes gene_type:complete